MRKFNAFWVGALAALVLAVGFTIYAFTGPSDDQANARVRLQLQWFDQAQFAGFYIAKEKGFYREEGLNVEIAPGGYATRPVELIETGQTDISIAPADIALQAIGVGKPINIIGTTFDRSMVCFMSRSSSNIHSPQDLKGKVVGVYEGFDTDNVLTLLLKKHGIEKSAVDIRPAGQLAAFEKGDFDVWPSYRFNEPLIMGAKNIAVDCLQPEDFGIPYYSDSLIVSDDYLSKHPDAVKAFMRATRKGWQYALDHPDEVVPIMYASGVNLDNSAQTRAHQIAMAASVLNYVDRPAGVPLLTTDMGRIREMTDLLIVNGIAQKATASRLDQRVRNIPAD